MGRPLGLETLKEGLPSQGLVSALLF